MWYFDDCSIGDSQMSGELQASLCASFHTVGNVFQLPPKPETEALVPFYVLRLHLPIVPAHGGQLLKHDNSED